MDKEIKIKHSKKITVLMPVYNSEKYLKDSIESILNQTYDDFDFLIINDGSTDSSEDIILSYKDKRIIYKKNIENLGLIKTLNYGIKLISTKYIVRMDSDDISYAKRFEKQLKYMEENPDIAVLGTSILIFNDKKVIRKHIVNTHHKTIKTELLFYSALMSPTVIIRKAILDENDFVYNDEHEAAEDFGLWQKISFKYKLSNLSEVLLKYRINQSGITINAEKNIEKRDRIHSIIYKQGFESLDIYPTKHELKLFRLFSTGRVFQNIEELKLLSTLLDQIIINSHIKNYDFKCMNKILLSYLMFNGQNFKLKLRELEIIHKEYFFNSIKFTLKDRIKYIIKRYLGNILKFLKKFFRGL